MSYLKDKNPKGATDILKVIVIFGLPFVHALLLILKGYGQEQVYSLINVIIPFMIFGSPVFLTCLGSDLLENRSYKTVIKMGIQISIINLLFNFFRFVIPDLILIFAGLVPVTNILTDLMSGDIYCFMGLFCIFYGFAKKFKCSLGLFSGISVALFILNLLLQGQTQVMGGGTVLSYFLGNFVSGHSSSFFSFFGWCYLPCIGLWLGKALRLEKKKRDTALAIIFLGSIVALIVTFIIFRLMGTNIVEVMVNISLTMTVTVEAAISMGLAALLVISLMYFIYQLIPQNKFETKVIMFSNLVMPFYLIHFLILVGVIFVPENICLVAGKDPILVSLTGYWILATCVTIATAILCYWKGFTFTRWLFKITDYHRWFKKKKKKTA